MSINTDVFETKSSWSELTTLPSDGATISIADALEKQRTNLRVVACCLPPELLVLVFQFAQHGSKPERGKNAEKGKAVVRVYWARWMTVLHVCSTWRHAALFTPTLWQNINILGVHPDSAGELLARSAGLPLHLTLDDHVHYNDWKYLVNSACNWLSADTLRCLDSLYIAMYKESKALERTLEQRAVNIRTLSVSAYMPRIPLLGLGRSSPLRQLSLNSCHSFPANFYLFAPNLTHVKLYSLHLEKKQGHTVAARLLPVLSALSALEYLHIDTFLREDFIDDEPLETVVFPYVLQYLSFHMDVWRDMIWDSCFSMTEHWYVPKSTDMHINLCIPQDMKYSQWCRVFRSSFSVDLGGDLSLELELQSTTKGCLYLWDPTSKNRFERRSLHISVNPNGNIKRIMLQCIQLTRPRSLVILSSGWQYIADANALKQSPDLWADVILAAQEVCCLKIYYRDHVHLWPVLRDERHIFPLLETIVLTSICCSWDGYKDDYTTIHKFIKKRPTVYELTVDMAVLPDLVSCLVASIESRRNTAVPIREVRIEGRLAEWNGWEDVRILVDVVRVQTSFLAG